MRFARWKEVYFRSVTSADSLVEIQDTEDSQVILRLLYMSPEKLTHVYQKGL